MILHLVTFRWKEGVDDTRVAELTAALRAMAETIPELRSYRCGENLRLRPGADYGVAALVADEGGLSAYLDSPAHVEVYARYLQHMVQERSAVQLPVGEDARL